MTAPPTEEGLRHLAAGTGYRAAALETVTRPPDLLPTIMNDPALGPDAVLY